MFDARQQAASQGEMIDQAADLGVVSDGKVPVQIVLSRLNGSAITERIASALDPGQLGGTAARSVRVEPVHEGGAGEERRLDLRRGVQRCQRELIPPARELSLRLVEVLVALERRVVVGIPL